MLVLLRARKILSLLSRAQFLRAFLKAGTAPAIEHTFLFKKAYGTILDVGANRGQFSIVAAAHLPSVEIVAFEPIVAEANRCKLALGSHPNFALRGSALGSTRGTARLHVSASADSSSLLPISSSQSSLYPGTQEIGTEEVTVETLDEVFFDRKSTASSPVLLKIDVQGFELDVLKGAERTLRFVDDVYCECSFLELYDGQALATSVIVYLSSQGFELKGAYNVTYHDMTCIQADLLFSRAAGSV